MLYLTPLTATHAAGAARLHIAGQPGTFLTSLGPDVLTVFYRTLPQSPTGFGFAAMTEPGARKLEPIAPALVGFISATTGVGSLFVEMGTRRLGQFLPPLLARYLRRPDLALRSVQTVLYPLLAHEEAAGGSSAELLSIMVEPSARSQGIGALLLQALLATCESRHIETITVTVDAENIAARRFYARHGFGEVHQMRLYGRRMCVYRRQR